MRITVPNTLITIGLAGLVLAWFDSTLFSSTCILAGWVGGLMLVPELEQQRRERRESQALMRRQERRQRQSAAQRERTSAADEVHQDYTETDPVVAQALAFERAAESGDVAALTRLIEVIRPSEDSSYNIFQKSLLLAAWQGHIPAAEYLLAHGATIDGLDAGKTALIQAVCNRKTEMVNFLISRGASVLVASPIGNLFNIEDIPADILEILTEAKQSELAKAAANSQSAAPANPDLTAAPALTPGLAAQKRQAAMIKSKSSPDLHYSAGLRHRANHS